MLAKVKFQYAEGTKSTGDTNTESESKIGACCKATKMWGEISVLKIEPTEAFECADVVYGQEISNCVH